MHTRVHDSNIHTSRNRRGMSVFTPQYKQMELYIPLGATWGETLVSVCVFLFLHLVRTVVRVNDPRNSQLLLTLLLCSHLQLSFSFLQEKVVCISTTVLLQGNNTNKCTQYLHIFGMDCILVRSQEVVSISYSENSLCTRLEFVCLFRHEATAVCTQNNSAMPNNPFRVVHENEGSVINKLLYVHGMARAQMEC